MYIQNNVLHGFPCMCFKQNNVIYTNICTENRNVLISHAILIEIIAPEKYQL